MKTKSPKTKQHGGARPNAGRPPKTVPPPAPMPSEPASPPVDPIAVLESIAVDRLTPATARVAACKALLAHKRAGAKPVTQADDLSARAIEIMSRGGRSLQ